MSDTAGHFISDQTETRLLQLTCRNAPPKNELQLRPSPRRVWGYDVQAFVGTSGHWKGRIAGFQMKIPRRGNFDVASQRLATLLVTWADRPASTWARQREDESMR